MDSLTLDEIEMKEDLDVLYEEFSYEERFGPFEVNTSVQRKQSTDTWVIMKANNISSLEIKEILGEDRKSSLYRPSLFCNVGCFGYAQNEIPKKKIYIAKELDAKVTITTSLAQASTLPMIGPGISPTSRIS